MHHVLLLTGAPGVGKTTVIRRVAGLLGPEAVRGFFTEEIRRSGVRRGFGLEALGDARAERAVLAHVDVRGGPRVGRYGVDVAALDRFVEAVLEPTAPGRVWLVDEIGKMELFSDRFVAAMRRLLDSDALLVATVSRKGGGLIAEAKARDDVFLREVTRGNRDALPEETVAWVRRHAEARSAPRLRPE